MQEKLEDKTDQELYKMFLEKNEEAFNQIVFRYHDAMIYFITRYTRDTMIAEDISQDVFVYLLLNPKQYKFEYSFKTYLYMIAKCRALNYLKREKKIISLQEYQNYEEKIDYYGLEDNIEKSEKSDKIQKVMQKMNPDYQAVLYLSQFEGFKYREIAQIMNKNIGQIKILISRSKKKLKQLLEKEGFFYDGKTGIFE